jgi:site-specific recombinase XerD
MSALKTATTLKQEIWDYYEVLNATRSKRTAINYLNDLKRYSEFTKGEFDLSQQTLERFIRDPRVSSATRNRRLCTLRSFCQYLVETGRIPANTAKKIDHPKREYSLPVVLTREQIQHLLKHGPGTKHPLRDRAMLELFYGTGIRLNEAANLLLTDVDFASGEIVITGKGDKTRVVLMGAPCKAVLQKYAQTERLSRKPLTNHFFVRKSGKPLVREEIAREVRRMIRAAGLPPEVTTHTLRHTFATHMLDGGANIKTLQQLLGHTSLHSTQIYVHTSVQRLRDTVDRAHPHRLTTPNGASSKG